MSTHLIFFLSHDTKTALRLLVFHAKRTPYIRDNVKTIINMGENFRINPEFRILRLTFHRKSAS